jgi:hypothetical protein
MCLTRQIYWIAKSLRLAMFLKLKFYEFITIFKRGMGRIKYLKLFLKESPLKKETTIKDPSA